MAGTKFAEPPSVNFIRGKRCAQRQAVPGVALAVQLQIDVQVLCTHCASCHSVKARLIVGGTMRIVSLLSSATEIVCALGLEEQLVGISHECDYPEAVLDRPVASRSCFDPAGLTSEEIDRAVRKAMAETGSVYTVDAEVLRELEPDLVLTQAVCDVCAVPAETAASAIQGMDSPARLLSLDAGDIEGIFKTVLEVAQACGIEERGRETVDALRRRLSDVDRRVAQAVRRPRVLALEWLDPPFTAGHWVPEMIERAGGIPAVGSAGERSREARPEELAASDPEVLLAIPCGYSLDEAEADVRSHESLLSQVGRRAVEAGDVWIGSGEYFSRSGPRIVDGIEALTAAIHPEVFDTARESGISRDTGILRAGANSAVRRYSPSKTAAEA